MTTADRVLRLLFSTLKGGPGKTTSAVLTAVALSRRGFEVVVVCADTRTRGATDWVEEAERVGDQVPFQLAIWHESDGPLSQFARKVERQTGAGVVIIDTGGEQPENFTHGCLYADWLIAPVGPFRAELRRVVPTYESAAAVNESGSPLDVSILLTRVPVAHKGKARDAREALASNLVDTEGRYDADLPYALGLDVLNTEITRSVAYDEFYGLIPEDVGEYDDLAAEILRRRGLGGES